MDVKSESWLWLYQGEEEAIHFKWWMAKLHNKRLTGIEGDLSMIAIRWTCQGVLYLHLKLHFGVLTLIRDSTDDFPLFYNFMFANTTLLKGAGGLEDY